MTGDQLQKRLKKLPQIGSLLERPELQKLIDEYSHDFIKHCVIKIISRYRQLIVKSGAEAPARRQIIEEIRSQVEQFVKPRIGKVLNATGILLHTGLGRAPLSDDIYQEAFRRVQDSCALELDLDSGKRGDRQDNLEDLLCFITGAENAAVVNNNAAAVLIALNTFANRKETIVARGQLIEIGGSFRLPEVMKKSGTKLIEVGTTNKTYLRDYEAALTPRTRAILVAHSSNYRIQGFVHEEAIDKLADLCRKNNLHLIHDLGGGVIYNLKDWKLPQEPVVSDSVKSGVHVVTFSGDKVLGGPQAGIIVGEKNTLQRIRKNHLMRALRPDKFTLALLEETLKIYLSPHRLLQHHPVMARLTESQADADERTHGIIDHLEKTGIPEGIILSIRKTKAQLGSGALPLEEFPSAAIAIKVQGMHSRDVSKALRLADPPLVGYTSKEAVLLDTKAILDRDVDVFIKSLSRTLQNIGH